MAKKVKTIQSITNDYNAKIIANQKRIAKEIDDLYNELINQVAPLGSVKQMPKGVFKLNKLAGLDGRVDQLIKQLNAKIEVIAKNGILDAWELSNKKNDVIADIRLKGSSIPKDKQLIYYNTNSEALAQFIERKVSGLDLSDRIYKQGELFKSQLEAGIGEGIAVGRNAADLGRSLKQYLKAPDLLFRRVRDAKGKLRLSNNAATFHPGQGIYRSASKNIQRLTRTENNTAYRSADMARYQQSPFITGYEVKLSAQHPRFDICDSMKGKYPVDFKFIGWHPQCLCFCVPILMTDDQFIKYQTMVKNGTDSQANVGSITGRVMTIPDGASKWISDNKQRVAGWEKPPLWWKQNSTFVPSLK